MNLYEEYGKLMVQLEILNNRIREVKEGIALDLNKNKEPKEEPKEE